MSLLGKRGSKKGSLPDEIHTRRQYVDHSLNFLNWVNQLGFERSPLGRLAYFLDKKFNIRIVSLLFLFCLGLSALLYYDFEMVGEYSVGEIAPADIKSPMNLVIVDEVATEENRVEAEKSLPLILDYEVDAYEPVYNRVYKSFRTMRNLVRETEWSMVDSKYEEQVKEFVRNKAEFEKIIEQPIPDHLFEWLILNKFRVRIENILINAIKSWSNLKIIDASEGAIRDPDRTVVIREITPTGRGREFNAKAGIIKNIRDLTNFALTDIRGYNTLSEKDREALSKIALIFLISNVSVNKQEFAERHKKVRDSVLPVQISIKKNQTIVSAGSPIQPRHLTVLGEIRNVRSEQRTDFLSLFSALLFVLLVITLFTFIKRYSRNTVKIETKDILLMATITTALVIITRLFLFLVDSALVDKYGEVIPQMAFLVASPVAAGSMLVGLLIMSVDVVWIFTIFLAAVMAIMTELNMAFFLMTLISGISGAIGVFSCPKRNDIYWAGLRTGLINAMAIFLIYSLSHLGEADIFKSLLWCVPAAFLGGILSSFVAMTFLPLLESIFGYTTDIKLLELSSLNHPLMQEMMMKAPGTYHHAMNVGNMCDAAAKEIGANPLLAKVMAYYHDIGKTEHAQYFIENQRPGYNPHDHVSPHMSKTILVAHVKDGAEMAIKHKLGKPIVDGILQHHGTTLISYFYNKALEEQDEDVTGAVEESDFRYPGPKPQFKEAALVMLADSIEATARSLEEPTQGRLNSIVENIIESKFMDGQLDECNLSIHDLAVIKETFKRLLLAMYHHRLDYPHMRDGKLVAVAPQAPKKPNSTKRA